MFSNLMLTFCPSYQQTVCSQLFKKTLVLAEPKMLQNIFWPKIFSEEKKID
jgi:hypothetical protein